MSAAATQSAQKTPCQDSALLATVPADTYGVHTPQPHHAQMVFLDGLRAEHRHWGGWVHVCRVDGNGRAVHSLSVGDKVHLRGQVVQDKPGAAARAFSHQMQRAQPPQALLVIGHANNWRRICGQACHLLGARTTPTCMHAHKQRLTHTHLHAGVE